MPIPRLRSLSSNIQRWTASAGVSTLSAVHRSNISFASLHISQSFGAALPSTTSSSPHCQISTRCRGLFTRQHGGGTSADINRRQLSSSRRHNNNTLKDLAWYEKYLLLKAYKERKGDCLVPQSLVQEGDVKLGQWVAAQRLLSKRGRLSQNRREMLDDIGFSFDPRSDRWEGNFALLLQFKEREGHCNVPKDHKENKEGDVQLGAWLDTQRQAMKKGKLDDVYIQRLEEAGVSWESGATTVSSSRRHDSNTLKDLAWYEKYLLLKAYKQRKGDCMVPRRLVEGDVKLGQWVAAQRLLSKRGRLSQNRREMLDDIGFSWDPRSDRWEGNFALLLQFKEREGHCNVPKDHKEGDVQLGAWLDTQRQAMKKGKLDDVYIQGLEEAGVSWEPQKDYWDRNYALLLKYKEREGHGNVPYKHQEDGVNLGTWLDAQRQAKKGNRGKIDDVHIQRLEEAGVSWNRKSIENDWDETLLCLEIRKSGRETATLRALIKRGA